MSRNCFRKTCDCGDEILMANKLSGGWVPLDLRPVDGGRAVIFAFDEDDPGSLARQIDHAKDAGPGERVYASHFLLCPNANQHSRRRGSGGGVVL